MGAALVQHPKMYHAIVSFVGIYGMLRSEAITPNAVFKITEFGTVKDAEQFKALYAYSPYHHIVDRTAYPAVLFLTGVNDPRVNPRKLSKDDGAAASGDPLENAGASADELQDRAWNRLQSGRTGSRRRRRVGVLVRPVRFANGRGQDQIAIRVDVAYR